MKQITNLQNLTNEELYEKISYFNNKTKECYNRMMEQMKIISQKQNIKEALRMLEKETEINLRLEQESLEYAKEIGRRTNELYERFMASQQAKAKVIKEAPTVTQSQTRRNKVVTKSGLYQIDHREFDGPVMPISLN